MLRTMTRMADATSRRGGRFLLVFGAGAALLVAMLALGPPFQAATGGHPPFDFQSTLTVDMVREQVPHYTAESKRLYWIIDALDWPFPFLGALTWAAIAGWAMRRLWPAAYERGTLPRLLPLFFVGAAFDWVENAANVALVAAAPEVNEAAAHVTVIAKLGKLAGVNAAMLVALGLGAAALVAGALRSRAARRAP